MERWNQAAEVLASGHDNRPAGVPAADAEPTFATLVEQAERQRSGVLPIPGSGPVVDPPAQATATPDAGHPPDPREVLDSVLAVLATTDRLAEMMEGLVSQLQTSAADLAALRRAIELEHSATNDRLASLEQILLTEEAGAARMVSRLRRTLHQATGGC